MCKDSSKMYVQVFINIADKKWNVLPKHEPQTALESTLLKSEYIKLEGNELFHISRALLYSDIMWLSVVCNEPSVNLAPNRTHLTGFTTMTLKV